MVVLPYTRASQSGVGVIAIAAGVRVVVTDVGTLPELVHDRSFVVGSRHTPSRSPTSRYGISITDRRSRTRPLRHAQSRYSCDHAARLSTNLYRALVAQSDSRSDQHHAAGRRERDDAHVAQPGS